MKNMFYLHQGEQMNLREGASESFSRQVLWNWNGFFSTWEGIYINNMYKLMKLF